MAQICTSAARALMVEELVDGGYGFLSSTMAKWRKLLAGFACVSNAESSSAAEDDNVEQRVGSEAIGSVDRGTANLWHCQ